MYCLLIVAWILLFWILFVWCTVVLCACIVVVNSVEHLKVSIVSIMYVTVSCG